MVAVCQLLAFAIYLGGIMATLGLLNNHEEDKNHFCFSLLLLFFFPQRITQSLAELPRHLTWVRKQKGFQGEGSRGQSRRGTCSECT